ncbi:MAG: hypothetical protein LBP36_03195, partial [Oscillospiraceae bacterium]|nr:hypothetical protein [Oscillospiraceae bacterium]
MIVNRVLKSCFSVFLALGMAFSAPTVFAGGVPKSRIGQGQAQNQAGSRNAGFLGDDQLLNRPVAESRSKQSRGTVNRSGESGFEDFERFNRNFATIEDLKNCKANDPNDQIATI